MKHILLFILSIQLVFLSAQTTDHSTDWKIVQLNYSSKFPKKNWCPININDSTYKVAIMPDTNAFLKYYNSKYYENYLRESDSINKILYPKQIIPSLTFNKKNKNDEKIKKQENIRKFIIKNGITHYFKDNFDTTGISKDYTYSLTIVIDVNCNGGIFDVLFIPMRGASARYFNNINNYEYSQYVKFSESVFHCLENMPQLSPAVQGGKKVNQRELIIETGYSERGFIAKSRFSIN